MVYEHGFDGRPYSSSHIRLLRPLTHPSLAQWISISAATDLCDGPVDLVVLDRLWRDDVSPEQAEHLVDQVRRRRARFMYSLDDNLLRLLAEPGDNPAAQRKLAALQVFTRAADRVVVSTWHLREALREHNGSISVIPNYLDERLLPGQTLGTVEELRRRLTDRRRALRGPITLGYMGTRTHDDDLRMIAPVIWRVWSRHPGRLRLEFVAGMAKDETWSLLKGLPINRLDPGLVYTEYAAFMPWFVATCRWHIALAPLADTAFNRCKSDIKFLDYGALGAAGVFSRSPAYERTVQHKVTGYLVDNTPDAWEDTLENLIAHPIAALVIGWSAQRYLRQRRTLAQGAQLWLNALRVTLTQGA